MPKDKTYMVRNWEEWVEYCREHKLNPEEVFEHGWDLGGGNSLTVYVHEYDIPNEVNKKWETKYMIKEQA